MWLRFPVGVIAGESRPRLVPIERMEQVREVVLATVVGCGIRINDWYEVHLLDEDLRVAGVVSYLGQVIDAEAYRAAKARFQAGLDAAELVPAVAGA